MSGLSDGASGFTSPSYRERGLGGFGALLSRPSDSKVVYNPKVLNPRLGCLGRSVRAVDQPLRVGDDQIGLQICASSPPRETCGQLMLLTLALGGT
jgi:hypothetical protein